MYSVAHGKLLLQTIAMSLRDTLHASHNALSYAGVDHALVAREAMSFEEYLRLLDEYWEMFGPIEEKVPNPSKFENIKL